VTTVGRPEAEKGAPLNAPIVLGSTYRTDGDMAYGRDGNPTVEALEEALGVIERGTCLAFSSGRFALPACSSAAIECSPAVQLNTSTPRVAASANEPSLAFAPAACAQSRAFTLPASREPIFTSWPRATSRLAIALPTMPVPKTPTFIVATAIDADRQGTGNRLIYR
jgi:hypothetical protein